MSGAGGEDEILNSFVGIVRAYYEADPVPRPLLMSRFGQSYPELRARLVESFGSLGEAVARAGEDKLLLLRSAAGRPGSEVLVPPDKKEEVGTILAERTSKALGTEQTMKQLPFSMQVAFCARTEPGEQIVLELSDPFKYHKMPAAEPTPPGMLEIEDRFRRPDIKLRTATASQKEAVWLGISKWAALHELDLNIFMQRAPVRAGGNALARLIAAQPRDILAKLVIPADIAELLQKHD